MRVSILAALSLLLAASLNAEDSAMERFLLAMQGDFVRDMAQAKQDESPWRDRRMRVDVPVLGGYVVYLQINSGEDMSVYRQRLLVLTQDGDDQEIVQQAWAFNQPERFVDAFEDPARFSSLTMDDLRPNMAETGCAQLWTESGQGWYGYVNPDTCRIWSERRQAWRRIEAESRLLPGVLMQAERGYDDEGNQVFGTEPGEFYRLLRESPDQSSN